MKTQGCTYNMVHLCTFEIYLKPRINLSTVPLCLLIFEISTIIYNLLVHQALYCSVTVILYSNLPNGWYVSVHARRDARINHGCSNDLYIYKICELKTFKTKFKKAIQ